ncbi:MAG: hypothetical protein O3C10_00285 [Chloroflexi bacterium]|nr:hypothetical protein [Chloroflexota bacterium]
MTIDQNRFISRRDRYEALETPGGRAYVSPPDRTLVITEIIAAGPGGTPLSVGYADDNVSDPYRRPDGAVKIWSTTLKTDSPTAQFSVNLRIPGGKYVWSCAVKGAWAMPVSGSEEIV